MIRIILLLLILSVSVEAAETPGAYWGFYGDSQTEGRAPAESTCSSSPEAIETINPTTTPTDTVDSGVSGRSLAESNISYENYASKATLTWVHFQESGYQNSDGQRTSSEFGSTFETVMTNIATDSTSAIISYETAFSFGREAESYRDWTDYNTQLPVSIATLAGSGITVILADVNATIVALQTSPGYAPVDVWYQSDESYSFHYKPLGNFAVAVTVWAALGYSRSELNVSAATDISEADRNTVLDIVYGAIEPVILNDFNVDNPVETMANDSKGVYNNTTNTGYESDSGAIWAYEGDRTHGPDPQFIYVGNSNCVSGDCLRVDIKSQAGVSCGDTGNPGNYYLYDYSAFYSKPIFSQVANADQLTFYISLPSNYPEDNSYNMHVGTYTKDSGAPDLDNGSHYYHWYDIVGSTYWTKIIVGKHPQNKSGVDTDPGVDPETWDYIQGFNRFYIDGTGCSPIGEYSMFLDEIKFSELSEAQDEENIASISCTYLGSGQYRVQWYRQTHIAGAAYSGHTYSIRWSESEITNSNHTSATLISNTIVRNPDTGAENDEFETTFTIAKTEGTVYFALYDETAANGIPTTFSYGIHLAPTPTARPTAFGVSGTPVFIDNSGTQMVFGN